MLEAVSAFSFAALADYLERGIGSVEGWLWPTTASMIARFLVQQSSASLGGDVCEIGVHHGRLFLVLANATLAGERAVAVDVFDDQDKNVDQSGAGDRAMLERHIASYAPSATCEVIQQSSLDLPAGDFASRRFRFISIDGGHTADIVVNDLRLAEQTLLAGGLVALDDVMNHAWPGVVSGLSRYLAGGGTLVPFALIPNKLMLARDGAGATQGRAMLRHHFPLALSKSNIDFLGAPIDCYVDHPYYNREANVGLLQELEDLRQTRDTRAVAAATEQELRGELARMHREYDSLAANLARAREEASRLRASMSWQVTAPLRNLASFARRRGSD